MIDELPRGRGLFSPPPRQIVRDLPPVQVSPGGPVPLPPSWHREFRRVERHKPRHAERKIHHVERKAAPHAERRKTVVRGGPNDKRTIRAAAEVTILGPDRMTIRLFRADGAAKAEARKK